LGACGLGVYPKGVWIEFRKMRIFHFSEDAGIRQFEPRPVRVAATRRPGQEWLNGPLVWAIDEEHQRMYLFPRECPRILIWPHAGSSEADIDTWLGDLQPGMQAVAYVESAWADRLQAGYVYRYEFSLEAFQSIEDAGMLVSHSAVAPLAMQRITDLPQALHASRTELRIVDSLKPLRGVWDSSVHASGIRLRNAASWG
jgi:hypothetical protein